MTTDILYDIFSVEKLINLHELETSTTYRILKSDKNFGKENIDLSENTFTIRYDDTQKDAVPPIPYDGVPFIIRGKKTLECHQGKDRSKKKKERAQLLRNKELEDNTRYGRERLSAKIHNAIDKEDDVAVQHVYLISVPDPHQNHFTGEIITREDI
ncbi:unnamed protein product [Mytilus coruscus]|uniref:Uncharacterized protein n=1 Tax=Mytilus coruscus TaxID=42192 RepID=A0A6J8A1V5_MYTCO|nr:unnamed protein product [Mytilus coruscus]